MSSIAALPPPSAYAPAAAPSGVARLKSLLMSDAIAVTPVQPIPGDQQRRGRQPEVEATEDSVDRGSRSTTAESRRRAGGSGQSGAGGFAAGGGDERGPVTAGPVPLSAGPTAGYVAQTIAQEAMGTGLHIEPWATAIAAYRRADSGPSMPLVSRMSV